MFQKICSGFLFNGLHSYNVQGICIYNFVLMNNRQEYLFMKLNYYNHPQNCADLATACKKFIATAILHEPKKFIAPWI